MGQKLNAKENELYKRTDEVLHYLWDPIGISDEPDARDEYYTYLPQVFEMLIKNESIETIKELLIMIQKDRMGLMPNEKQIEKVVEILERYKEIIYDRL